MTMSIPFQTINVFTHTRFLGNPLAIAILRYHSNPSSNHTDQQSLTQQQKQLLAREFNLSETVFIHTTQANYNNDDPTAPFVIDIFTTTQELPFAGHPTVGAAWFLAQQGEWKSRTEFRLLTRAGEILVTRIPSISTNTISGDVSDGVKQFVKVQVPIDFKTHASYHSPTTSTLKSELHQPLLGPSNFINGINGSEPVASVVKGMSFMLMQLQNEETLAKFQPLHGISEAEFRIPDEHLGDWKGFSGLYVFVVIPNTRSTFHSGFNSCSIFDGIDLNNDDTDSHYTTIRVRTRMFQGGGFEDPATGSAASTLCGWLAVQNGVGKWRFEVIQGVEIGRESRIGVLVNVDKDMDGSGNGLDGLVVRKIELVGGAVKVMEGLIEI
ncbi:hypothetical protein J3R30DRAFT_3454127 [Lentinula aciculospora]|uniref:Diaminopimelate epimerase-like protein n=1 Tax=Lentinula aciculospora TaxID=153920 RepID=A0A9W9AKP4_9AGAR|nr:hypothetical protein J3R30DRAFT_3454127 [Lentinula aciculospora]